MTNDFRGVLEVVGAAKKKEDQRAPARKRSKRQGPLSFAGTGEFYISRFSKEERAEKHIKITSAVMVFSMDKRQSGNLIKSSGGLRDTWLYS